MTFYFRHHPQETFHNPQPLPMSADKANFGDVGDRIKLAKLGVFSVDATKHREQRLRESRREAELEAAYHYYGFDRQAEYSKIAGIVVDRIPAGVWPQSTAEYGNLRLDLDVYVLNHFRNKESGDV